LRLKPRAIEIPAAHCPDAHEELSGVLFFDSGNLSVPDLTIEKIKPTRRTAESLLQLMDER
jgi:hypothetical protein